MVRLWELVKFLLFEIVQLSEWEKVQDLGWCSLILGMLWSTARMDPIRWLQDLHADVGELLPPEGSP
jgi:hypothetical protein